MRYLPVTVAGQFASPRLVPSEKHLVLSDYQEESVYGVSPTYQLYYFSSNYSPSRKMDAICFEFENSIYITLPYYLVEKSV